MARVENSFLTDQLVSLCQSLNESRTDYVVRPAIRDLDGRYLAAAMIKPHGQGRIGIYANDPVFTDQERAGAYAVQCVEYADLIGPAEVESQEKDAVRLFGPRMR